MISIRQATRRGLATSAIGALLVAACGDEADNASTTSPTLVSTTWPATSLPATTTATSTTTTSSTTGPSTTTTATTTSTPTTSTPATAPPTTTINGLEQPALWPAPGVVFTTPEAAAADFVTQVLAVPPNLGEFVQGDSRSGEIDVLSPPEGGGTPVPRAVLFLRQLGPRSSWFVIAAGSADTSIATPAPLAQVPAGIITVEGMGHGFEASIMVSAYLAGDPAVFTQQHTMAGSMEEAGPFSVQLDLSAVPPGTVVMLMVRGGVGLETDPGEFSAIPIVITTP